MSARLDRDIKEIILCLQNPVKDTLIVIVLPCPPRIQAITDEAKHDLHTLHSHNCRTSGHELQAQTLIVDEHCQLSRIRARIEMFESLNMLPCLTSSGVRRSVTLTGVEHMINTHHSDVIMIRGILVYVPI